MSKCLVLYGTLTMNTELVAERVFETVTSEARFDQVEFWNMLDVTDTASLEEFDFIIVGISTWGEGDYNPDTEEFLYLMDEQKPKLADKKFAIFGLGETTYEEFCGAAKNLEALWKEEYGMRKSGEMFTIDGYPEDDVLDQIADWTKNILTSMHLDD